MEDDIAIGYPYVVVQFLQLPYADIDDYSCVPYSWIRGRRATDRKSLILYPDEPPSITKMRIINNDKPSEKWKLYMAIIKHESHSYEDACEFIMGKIHNASKNRYSEIMRIDYNLSPPTTTKRYSPLLRTNKLSDPQSLLELPGFVSSENTVIKENCEKEHQDQTFCDFRSSSDHLLLRYPCIQRKPEKNKGIQVNSPGAGYRSAGKTLHALKCPLTLVNQICDYPLKPEENQLLSIHREHLHQIALTQGIQDSRIPNLRTFTLDFPEPLIQDPHIGSNTSFIIQNPTNEANQFSQLEIPESSLVTQEHPLVLPKQKTHDQFSEVECATSEPAAHSKMTSASHASLTCTNSSEHHEASCIGNIVSGTSADNECSANPKALKEANYLGQTIDSSMEEGSPMVEAVTSSGISSTQEVHNDKQSNSSDLTSDEIIITSSNSKEQENQSIISVLNQVDVWADQLYDLFQKMKSNFSEICQFAHDLHESLVQTQKVIECIANASENLRTLKKSKVAVVTSKEVTAEIQQIAEVNQAEKKGGGNLDVSMEEDEKENNDVDSKSSGNNDDCGEDIKDVKDQDRDNEDATGGLSGEELYGELVRWRARLHGRAANELHAFLTTNLLLLTKVRESLEALSGVAVRYPLTDMAEGGANVNHVPNETLFS
ncbi:unnamed protein product [Colias eurytheme]|nr:unnamed protein product [Colias eurytheme]